jgi:molybdopterin-guanine dinucleotide biosynthesis protein A
MIGVILCGGTSTRMGTDKGLLKEEGQTWAELAARKMAALHLPVFVSVNSRQFSMYEQIFPASQLVVDNESFEAKAPLFGLLSVHLQKREEDLFVLACDIRDMTTELMQRLLQRYNPETQEAAVYHTGDTPQPLCGIYSARGLKKIYDLFLHGELRLYSMIHTLEILTTNYVPVSTGDCSAFTNYNTPDEL